MVDSSIRHHPLGNRGNERVENVTPPQYRSRGLEKHIGKTPLGPLLILLTLSNAPEGAPTVGKCYGMDSIGLGVVRNPTEISNPTFHQSDSELTTKVDSFGKFAVNAGLRITANSTQYVLKQTCVKFVL